VYQPLAALSEFERSLLECAGGVRSSTHAFGLIAPGESLEIYEKDVDGEGFVCVGHTRLRELLALISFERTIPDVVVPFFFGKGEVSAARRELEVFQEEHPDVRPSVVQSVWHVPLRWFVCFDDSERRVEQVGDHPTIRYETSLDAASRRVGDALDTLTGEMVHPVMVGMIRELKEWLSGFDARSLIELDYASVAELLEPDELADDHSAADVWNAIRALGEGDLYYQRVTERWASARQLESLN
jgi:hypothetical protein